MRTNISTFRVTLTKIDKPTEVVSRGKIVGVWTPTSEPQVRGDAVPTKTGDIKPKESR